MRPPFPYISKPPLDADEIAYRGRVVIRVSVVFQLAVAAVCAWGWIAAGGSGPPLAVGLISMLILCWAIDLLAYSGLHGPDPVRRGGVFAWLAWLGFGCGGVVGLLLVSTIGHFSFRVTQMFIVIGLGWAFVELIRTATVTGERGLAIVLEGKRRIGWIWTASAMIIGPLLAGWIFASLVIASGIDPGATVRARLDAKPQPRRTCEPWLVGDQPIHIALALSGGGYRAALTHAGVLAALDEQCVPIDLLSTVSGGSIIGAAYALGLPPREFASSLARQKPGLSDTLLSMASVFKSGSRIYREHFRDVFFGNRALASLADSPTLLVNVTNMWSGTDRAREVITSSGAAANLDQLPIADAVSASGAYPGAFGPMELTWMERTPDSVIIGPHLFIDGGVVENLGIEGIRRYLTAMNWMEWYLHHPTILIVSDASGYASAVPGDRLVINPPADEVLQRANDIQFDALHRFLYAAITGEEDLLSNVAQRPAWRQFHVVDYPKSLEPAGAPMPIGNHWDMMTPQGPKTITVAPQKLLTVVIAATAAATGKMLSGKDFSQCAGPRKQSAAAVQERVSGFSTLYELGPDEVQDAFWLGYSLGQIYGQSIECARGALTGHPCEGPPSLPVVTCKP